MVDEKWWDLSGWKDLYEIYNIDEGANINQRSLEVGNNEIRFRCLGFWENEKEKRKAAGLGLYTEMQELRKVGFRVGYK